MTGLAEMSFSEMCEWVLAGVTGREGRWKEVEVVEVVVGVVGVRLVTSSLPELESPAITASSTTWGTSFSWLG